MKNKTVDLVYDCQIGSFTNTCYWFALMPNESIVYLSYPSVEYTVLMSCMFDPEFVVKVLTHPH